MNLYERYLNGETKAVYEEIYSLGQGAFNPIIFLQIDKILTETFNRVAFNLAIIYKELQRNGYLFVSDIKFDWQRPITSPDPDVASLLFELKRKIGRDRYIPLSLEYFYRIVGSCNFCWDWETNPDISWGGADPIDIPPIKDLLDLIDDDHDEDYILISGDDLQKDNVSGSCYNIELTQSVAIDSLFLGWNVPFIEYLRVTMNNCGFSMADLCNYESLNSFCDRVKPQLKDV